MSSLFIGLCYEFCGKMSFGKWTLANELVLCVHLTLQMSGLQSCVKSRGHDDNPAVGTYQDFTRACLPEPALFSVPNSSRPIFLPEYSILAVSPCFPTHSLMIPSQPSLCPQRPGDSCQGLQGLFLAPGVRRSFLPFLLQGFFPAPFWKRHHPGSPWQLAVPSPSCLPLLILTYLSPLPSAETLVHPAVALTC